VLPSANIIGAIVQVYKTKINNKKVYPNTIAKIAASPTTRVNDA
jgi:hypothetical protein